MAYSIIGIVNLALGRIGQPKIAALTEESVAAIQANAAWEYIRDEVLEAADWTFAKTRAVLALNSTAPVQGYDYAYTLPADFLRLCRERRDDPVVYPNSTSSRSYTFGELYIENTKYSYVVEALADGTHCLFTDYSNVDDDLIIQYIRREVNPARYTAAFVRAVADRLSAELAPVIVDGSLGLRKEQAAWARYDMSLRAAKGLNSSADQVANETGNEDWVRAGR